MALSWSRLMLAWLLLAISTTSVASADSEPEVGHVRVEIHALRLQVNDYTTRWQFKVQATVSAPGESELTGVDQATLQLANPDGRYVELLPRRTEVFPMRFKAANARLQFRAIEDTASRSQSNLPEGFCDTRGPYRLTLRLLGERYTAELSFGEPLQMRALQSTGLNGAPEAVRNYCMASEFPLVIETAPSAFGPVYYKRQDLKNLVYQLANIEDSLTSGSYHPPVESPQYVLQVRTGDATGTMDLLDPSRYIRGHQPFLIRSDWTETPLEFSPQELAGHKAVLVDFIRTDTPEAGAGFDGPTSSGDGWSGQIVVEDRVLYALYIDEPPTPGEVVRAAGDAVVEAEQAEVKPRGWR